MADMRRFLDLTGLGIYDAKIKEVISTGDANALAEAKKYFDDNKNLFEAAGTVATARAALEEAIAAVDTKVAAITDGESIDSFKDVETALAGKQAVGDYATKTEAQAMADGKDAAIAEAKKAGDDAQDAIDAYIESNDAALAAVADDVAELDAYVGDIPSNYTETNVISYINKKAEETLAAAQGGSSETAASVKQQLDNYKSENDTKVNKNTEDIATAQAAADTAQEHSEGVASDLAEAVETLEGADAAQVERIAALEDTIVGLSGAMHFEGVKDSVPTDVTGYEQGDVIIVGNKEYVLNGDAFVEFGDASVNAEAITALTGRVSTAEGKITTLEGEMDAVEGAVATKAEQTVVDGIDERVTTAEGKITTLEGKMTTAEGNITTLQGDMTQAQTDIAALQEKFGDGENSVSDMIADAVAVEASARETAVAGVQSNVDALAETVATKAAASELTTVSGKVGTLEGKVGTLETEMDEIQAASATHATKTEVEAVAGRMTTAEGKITTLEGEMDAIEGRMDDAEDAIDGKASQSDFDALATRVGTAETNIAANTAALAKFTEISQAEIEALFTA